MKLPDRNLIRLAEKIHDQLRCLQGARFSEMLRRTGDMIENLEQLRRSKMLLVICNEKNWNAAAEQMSNRVVQNLRDLPYHATEIETIVEASKPKLPAIRDILADLQQAQNEFENFHYDEDEDLLVVMTEAIELEGYRLGEFEIRLHIGSMSQFKRHGAIYRVVALNPHPAACNDAVTHPHVSDEHMCEGDAGAAIEATLTNGRICDFFQLVTAVLTNYNPGSPYVALADWEGRQCYDCGYTMSEDNTHWCSSCDNDYCDECTSYCRRCDETTCRGCLDECTACGDLVCSSCKMSCPECDRVICKACHDEGECPCVQEREEQQQQEQENDNDAEHVESTIAACDGDDATDNASKQVGIQAA
jgi:hypothetical protein